MPPPRWRTESRVPLGTVSLPNNFRCVRTENCSGTPGGAGTRWPLASARVERGQFHAGEVAFGVASVEAAVAEGGRGPTFAAEDLGARQRFEPSGRGFNDDQFAGVPDRDQSVARRDQAAGTHGFLRPLDAAGGEFDAAQVRTAIAVIAIHPI